MLLGKAKPLLCTKLLGHRVTFPTGTECVFAPSVNIMKTAKYSSQDSTVKEVAQLLQQAAEQSNKQPKNIVLPNESLITPELQKDSLEPIVVVEKGVKKLVHPGPRTGTSASETRGLEGLVASKNNKPTNMMKQLKFFQYYPSRVQQWVSYARMPKGHYNREGFWRNDPYLMETELTKRKELLELGRKRQMSKAVVEEREQMIRDNPLPPDLVGKYRFGVLPEETVDLSPKFKEWLTFRHANNSEINQFRVGEATRKWQTKPYDTGSTGVQIAVLTERINYLTAHIMKHKKDIITKKGLRELINKRFRLMKYCKRKNVPLYYELLKTLNLKDMA